MEAAVTVHAGMVRYHANRLGRSFAVAGVDVADLMQEGLMAVASAAASFDESRQVSFGTCAEKCACWTMLRWHSRRWPIMHALPVDDNGRPMELADAPDEHDQDTR